MLCNIVNTKTDDEFKKYYDCIKRAFYDEIDYKKQDYINILPDWRRKEMPEKEEDQIKEVNSSLDKIIQKVCNESSGMYFFQGDPSKRHLFPFVNNFHEYFLKHRKWNTPLRDPMDHVNAILRLHKPNNSTKKDQNYSAKSGDHNHFVNVVAATARLINYFSDPNKIRESFGHTKHLDSKSFKEYPEKISYKIDEHGKRIFTLMLASFFHDIGKTVVYHRHGMEGYIIISDHSSNSWYQIKKIAELYDFESSFGREDLLFIADLLNYHDQFGTLSTGEAGYQRIVDIIERIKRYSLSWENKDEQVKWSDRYLFDLWLLNIADIMVSVEYEFDNQTVSKFDNQKIWLKKEVAEKRIVSFFKESDKCKNLIHDLKIARSLLRESNKHRHSDICCAISDKARSLSDRHVVERIRRLVFSSLSSVVTRERKKIDDNKEDALLNLKEIFPFFQSTQCLSEFEIDLSIVRSIQYVRDFKDFCLRFSWIGQMDYCLGFFEKIISRAFDRVNYELTDIDIDQKSIKDKKMQYCYRTKLIRDKYSSGFNIDGSSNDEDLNKLQSKLIIENYIICVTMVLDLLLFREKSITRMKNVEFNETRERLTKEKIDTILAINGVYNSRRTLHLTLNTVFIY